MRVDRHNASVTFNGEDGDKLTVRYDNRGEPYRQGAAFHFESYRGETNVFLETRELERLAKLLQDLGVTPR